MVAPAPPRPERRSGSWTRSVPYLVLAGLVAAIVGVVAFTYHRDEQIRGAREAFIEALAAGDVQGAYEQLTDERRRAMTPQAFAAYADHPVIARMAEGNYAPPEEYHPGACMFGEIDMPEGQWSIQLFFLEEQDRWRLHSIGLQRPAPMGLATLLAECGFWKGTLAGYDGPRPEHVTPPTPNAK